MLAVIWLPCAAGRKWCKRSSRSRFGGGPRGPVAPAVTEPAFAAASTDKTVMGAIADNGVKLEMDADRALAPAESANVGLRVEPSAQAAPSRELAVRFKEKGDAAEDKECPRQCLWVAWLEPAGYQEVASPQGGGWVMAGEWTIPTRVAAAVLRDRTASPQLPDRSRMMLGAGGAGATAGARGGPSHGRNGDARHAHVTHGAVPETASDAKDYRKAWPPELPAKRWPTVSLPTMKARNRPSRSSTPALRVRITTAPST